jgi:hypothetical protein
MKNLRYVPMVLVLVFSFAACAITIPWDIMDEDNGVRVVMNVVPDDADVLLNGRFIGVAYEFTSTRSALRLASRYNELVFRKKGFRERIVDLREYSSRRITLKLELDTEEPGETSDAIPRPPVVSEPPEEPGQDQAYEAKSEPLLPQPSEKAPPAPEHFLTQVALTVIPEETAIYIDNRFWGLSQAADKPIFLRLPPGKHGFTAFCPGYKTFSREVAIPKQEKFSLDITLQK